MITTATKELLPPMRAAEEAEQHLHESNCHHIKIAHCDASGQIHVGFISEDGDLTCYAPVAATPQDQLDNKIPRGSLFNVCLKSAPGKFGLHRRTPQCRNTQSACWTDDNTHFLLEPVSFNQCQIRNRNCASDSTASTITAHDHYHDDKDAGSKSVVIKHDGHLDLFVRNNVNGDLDLHCMKDANSETCHVHGSLQRVNQDSIPSQDWLDLFVFANQTSTSTIKVYKGLCCKKEIPKIDHLLHDLCSRHDLKIQTDPKKKTVTVWHGSDIKSWLPAMCDQLCTGVFRCEIDTVNGEPVTSAVVSEQVDDDLLLHVAQNDPEGNVKIQYLASQEDEVLRRIVSSNATCTLLQCGGQPVYSHTVAIAKGLCCKKEIPKVEFALKDVAGLLCLRVHPKEKFVVVFTTLHDFIVDTVHTSLTAGGFTLVQPVVEEQQHGHAHHDGGDHGHAHHHAAKVLPPHAQQLLPSAGGIKLTRSVLSVKGVCCAAEVPSVLAVCNEIPGVSFASVSVISKQVYFKHGAEDANVAPLVAKRLTDNGFASMVLINGGESRAEQMRQVAQAPVKTERILLTKWYVILATVLWLVAWFSYIGGSAEPLKYLAVVSVALTLPKIAHKGWLSLRRRIMDINILMSIAVIGALAIQDFHEAATVTVIFSWSEWLEERASRRAKGAMQALVDLKPDLARTEDGQEISVDAVYVDQVLVVRSGDKIPVDGVLLSTSCDCDESNLTGESRPVAKQEGDLLNAGTLNVSPFTVKMKCTALAEDSAVNRMILLVEEAAQSRSPTEQVVERVAKIYTPIVVLVALLLATIPWSQGDEIGHEYLNIALTLLVVACPCALIISTPITYVCSMAQAATFGVLVKGGKYLETLAVLDCLCCDKTGTLTKGSFEVADYLILTAEEETMAFELLMKIEQHATHPIAQALARFSESKLTKLTDVEVYELELLPGTGVKATLSNGSVAVVVNKLDSLLPAVVKERIDAWLENQMGKTICWLVVDGNVLLGCSAADQVRDSAFPFVTQLVQQCKVRVVVLTGDNPSSADLLQREIPLLTSVFAGLSPEGKVDHVKRLREEGHIVGVCGDGVNDAPAFSIASIGIAMGVSGAPLAIETADVALMDNDLTKIPRLLKLARSTKRVIIQNITFALSTKMVMLGLTFAGMISLGVAIAVDVGSMLLVTLNGVRLLERASKKPSKMLMADDTTAKSMVVGV